MTMPLEKGLSIGLTSMAPSNEGFRDLTAQIPEERDDRIRSFISHIILDDDEASMQPLDLIQTLAETLDESNKEDHTQSTLQKVELPKFEIRDLREVHTIPEDEHRAALLDQDNLI